VKPVLAFACLFLLHPLPARSQAPTAAERQATATWVQKLYRTDGSFAPNLEAAATSTVGSTVQGIRALKYFGGELGDKSRTLAFFLSCWNADAGGFAPKPGGTVDVRTTALAIMGIADLDMTSQAAGQVEKGLAYVAGNATEFEDIRIGAAAFEATRKRCPQAAKWQEEIRARRGSDGTYGKGAAQARETASAVVTLLRLGADLEEKDAVLRALRAGQLKDGGWGKGDGSADLDTCYRVMRAFFMLRARPDVGSLRGFVARCRQADGSYAPAPGAPGALPAIYYAGVISHWLDELK